MTKKKDSSKIGRPTKYKPEYCQQMIDFFNIPPTRPDIRIINGNEISVDVANDLPFINSFAMKIGVNRDTLHEWTKVHEEFSDAYKKCKELQKQFLIINALNGNYNSTAFIFTAKNITDMRDKKEIDHGVAENARDFIKDVLNGKVQEI